MMQDAAAQARVLKQSRTAGLCTVFRALTRATTRPWVARGMIAAVTGAFLALYASTFTYWYTFDSLAYAINIRRFEQTGEAEWLFHPHHLLFNGCGFVFHLLLRCFDPEVSTLTALQAFTAVMGAVGLGAFAAWVYEETRSAWAAVTGAAALGGSFGWWFGSTDGRANLAATAVLLLTVYALRRAARLQSGRWCAAAGAAFGVTCLLHESHLLFFPVALTAAGATTEGGWYRRVRRVVILAGIFVLTVAIRYGVVLTSIKGVRSPAEASDWLLTYGRQGTWWNFDVPANLHKDVQAVFRLFTGQDAARLLQGMGDQAPWAVAARTLWTFLIAVAMMGVVRGVWWRRRAFLWVPTLALALYSAFFTVWDPGYFVHWFAQGAFLLALLVVGWHESAGHWLGRGLLSLCVLALAGVTWAGGIAPKTHAERNPHLQLALRVCRIADPQGLVVLSGMGGAAEAEVYVPYFARMQVLALHDAWAEAGGDTARATAATRALIDRVLLRGNRVYLLSEATHDPGSLRAMARRYGVTQAQIRDIFAPYERAKVDRNGYIVIFQLTPRPPAPERAPAKPTPAEPASPQSAPSKTAPSKPAPPTLAPSPAVVVPPPAGPKPALKPAVPKRVPLKRIPPARALPKRAASPASRKPALREPARARPALPKGVVPEPTPAEPAVPTPPPAPPEPALPGPVSAPMELAPPEPAPGGNSEQPRAV